MSESFPVHSVSELTAEIKSTLEGQFFDVLVEGEISQPKLSSNGHLYFTLKDNKAQLSCVMWRSSVKQLKRIPEHGKSAVIGGEIQVYLPHGKYQFITRVLHERGAGALQEKFEALKRALLEEGLFDARFKQKIPTLPFRIGVVTSASSAAYQDIVRTTEQRFPMATLVLHHAATQGETAAQEIAQAIAVLDESARCDVIIVGRGGGSLEDLWCFNEEVVARAIFNARTPIISAVGHETDVSISDFVADARAATPTQAAVMATPDKNDLLMWLEEKSKVLFERVRRHLRRLENDFVQVKLSYGLREFPVLLQKKGEKVEHLQQRMFEKTRALIQRREHQALQWTHRLEKGSPNAPLEKGFVRVMQGEKWQRSANDLENGAEVELLWHDGKRRAKIGD